MWPRSSSSSGRRRKRMMMMKAVVILMALAAGTAQAQQSVGSAEEFLSNFDLENAGTKLFDQVDRFLGVEGNRRQLAQFLSPFNLIMIVTGVTGSMVAVRAAIIIDEERN